jgi:hypothetical protein
MFLKISQKSFKNLQKSPKIGIKSSFFAQKKKSGSGNNSPKTGSGN